MIDEANLYRLISRSNAPNAPAIRKASRQSDESTQSLTPQAYYGNDGGVKRTPAGLAEVTTLAPVAPIRSPTERHKEHYQTLYFLMRTTACPAASCVNRLNRPKMAREAIPEPAG